MKLEGDFLFEAPVDVVWQALFDPVVLAAVMPGCEKLDRVDGRYQGELVVKIGPVQGKFGGKVDLKDIDEPHGYTMLVEGRGAPGFVRASAAVKLEPEGAGTRLRYDADAQVGGKIASVGQRLLEASARAISKQSLEGLHENIKIRAAARAATPAPAPAPAPATAPPGDVVPTGEEAPPTAAAGAGSVALDDPHADRPGAPVAEREAAPAEGSAPAAMPAPAPLPVKTVSQSAMAASIAREVTRSLLPKPVLIAVSVALALVLGWFVLR